MPHSLYKWQFFASLFFYSFTSLNFIIAQKNCPFVQENVFLPDINQNVPASAINLSDKNLYLKFIQYQKQSYLKVIFDTSSDSTDKITEKFKSEIEIKSNSKLYYKKDYPIYLEKNHLFFVLLLPPNYIKTLINDGITEIIVLQKTFKLNKKTTKQIKETGVCLLSEK